jgi:hypothetical protein
MSVQRVYVGESGGENLDVARETGGKARFEKGDTVTISKDLADRLDRSWATEGEAEKRGVASLAPRDEDEGEAKAKGGDDS